MGDMLMVPMMRTSPWCHPHPRGKLLVVPVMGGVSTVGESHGAHHGGCP